MSSGTLIQWIALAVCVIFAAVRLPNFLAVEQRRF